jgi:predicted XRE-type DNA-binding protein
MSPVKDLAHLEGVEQMKTATEKTKRSDVTHGSGNVFEDLGFGGEAAELQVKAELTRQLHNRIKLLKLRQTDAAKRLGISQPDVSKLMNGRHTGFSIDRLMTLLNGLAVDVEIVLRPHKKPNSPPGHISVTELVAV